MLTQNSPTFIPLYFLTLESCIGSDGDERGIEDLRNQGVGAQ